MFMTIALFGREHHFGGLYLFLVFYGETRTRTPGVP